MTRPNTTLGKGPERRELLSQIRQFRAALTARPMADRHPERGLITIDKPRKPVFRSELVIDGAHDRDREFAVGQLPARRERRGEQLGQVGFA